MYVHPSLVMKVFMNYIIIRYTNNADFVSVAPVFVLNFGVNGKTALATLVP